MCTILTIDARKYNVSGNGQAFQRQILDDSICNFDGFAMVFLDPKQEYNNTIYRTMNVDNLLANIGMLMSDASGDARIFIHMRAATTFRVGVGFTHGFDDMQGIVYMHNGVINNTKKAAVDSFLLASMQAEGGNLLDGLMEQKESFANVFRIDTELYNYCVTRLTIGSLYTDGQGNYSTNPIPALGIVVDVQECSFEEHWLTGDTLAPWDDFDQFEDLDTEDDPTITGDGLAENHARAEAVIRKLAEMPGYGSGYGAGYTSAKQTTKHSKLPVDLDVDRKGNIYSHADDLDDWDSPMGVEGGERHKWVARRPIAPVTPKYPKVDVTRTTYKPVDRVVRGEGGRTGDRGECRDCGNTGVAMMTEIDGEQLVQRCDTCKLLTDAEAIEVLRGRIA